jgi:flotillin
MSQINVIQILMIVVPILLVLGTAFYVFSLRRMVPTNVVHIVQRGAKTVSYGVGKGTNVYYEFPRWMPKIGVIVQILPVSNFDIELVKYSAYDKDRVPFFVDVKAFFSIADTNIAAEKVSSFEELKSQLKNIVEGAVRSILAKSKLEEIMEERSIFGDKFTEGVNKDLANWGVAAIKSIELMDVRDADGSNVIQQIMAKRISAIDMESRTEVAKNKKIAEQAELEAQKEISITKAETQRMSGEAQAVSQQAIAIANAESQKNSGIAIQNAKTEVKRAEKITTEQEMEVIKVNEVKKAEIDREKGLIDLDLIKRTVEVEAEAEKFKTIAAADAKLETEKRIYVIGINGICDWYAVLSNDEGFVYNMRNIVLLRVLITYDKCLYMRCTCFIVR